MFYGASAGGYVYVIFTKPGPHHDDPAHWVVEYVGSTVGGSGPYCRLSKHRSDGRYVGGDTCDFIVVPDTVNRRVVESLIWETLRPPRNRRDPKREWTMVEGQAALAFLVELRDEPGPKRDRMGWVAARVLARRCASYCPEWCGFDYGLCRGCGCHTGT